jgi:hypothetical protein
MMFEKAQHWPLALWVVAQQEQEQEQQQVGQEVVPPGVRTTLDGAEHVEPTCLLKRSMVVSSFHRGMSADTRGDVGRLEDCRECPLRSVGFGMVRPIGAATR